MNKKQLSLKTAQEHYARGRKHFYDGKLEDAEKDLTNAILQNQEFTEAWVVRGNVYTKMEKHDTAIENFMQALRLLSTNKQLRPGEYSRRKVIILFRIAAVKLAQGKIDDAIRFSIESMSLMEGYTMIKNFAEPWYIQGMAWLKRGRDDRALNCFTRAAAKYTRDSYYENSLLERARLRQKSWRFKEAFDACNSILQQNPGHVEALVERACSRLGKHSDGRARIWKISAKPCEYPRSIRKPGLCWLIACLAPGGLRKPASLPRRRWSWVPKMKRAPDAWRSSWEQRKEQRKQGKKALADYHAFVRSYPCAKISSHRKNARLKGEEFVKAIAETGSVLLVNPNDVGARSKRVAAWVGKGNLQNAREDLDRLIELQPDDSDFLGMLELVEFF